MDADSWTAHLSSASKRYQSTLQSQSDMFMGIEEIEADDDIRDEYLCPFCSEYFDIVGLCCHIDDEHPVEAKNGGVEDHSSSTSGGDGSAATTAADATKAFLYGGKGNCVVLKTSTLQCQQSKIKKKKQT